MVKESRNKQNITAYAWLCCDYDDVTESNYFKSLSRRALREQWQTQILLFLFGKEKQKYRKPRFLICGRTWFRFILMPAKKGFKLNAWYQKSEIDWFWSILKLYSWLRTWFNIYRCCQTRCHFCQPHLLICDILSGLAYGKYCSIVEKLPQKKKFHKLIIIIL